MFQKIAILSGLLISTTCTFVPIVPIQIPVLLQLHHQQTQQPQNTDDSNYNFAYKVNDERTGDIKSQQETKSGGTITGQYSLIQPDGIRRTVNYHADDLRGFRAQINNERNIRPLQDSRDDSRNAVPWPQNHQDQASRWTPSDVPQWPQNEQNGAPHWQQDIPNPAPLPKNGATVIAQWQQIVPNDAVQWQQNKPNVAQQNTSQLTQNSQNVAPRWPQNNEDTPNNAAIPAPAAISRTSVIQSFQTRRIMHPPSNTQNQ